MMDSTPSAPPMKTSPEGIAAIKGHEALRLEIYADQGGLATIGYGHLIKQGELFTTITEEEALEILAEDIIPAERAVSSFITAKINQNQFDALVSFTFNCGVQALRSSSLRTAINGGASQKIITLEFMKWVHVKKAVSEDLMKRRANEVNLFFT